MICFHSGRLPLRFWCDKVTVLCGLVLHDHPNYSSRAPTRFFSAARHEIWWIFDDSAANEMHVLNFHVLWPLIICMLARTFINIHSALLIGPIASEAKECIVKIPRVKESNCCNKMSASKNLITCFRTNDLSQSSVKQWLAKSACLNCFWYFITLCKRHDKNFSQEPYQKFIEAHIWALGIWSELSYGYIH